MCDKKGQETEKGVLFFQEKFTQKRKKEDKNELQLVKAIYFAGIFTSCVVKIASQITF
jgi:hypothetical protein